MDWFRMYCEARTDRKLESLSDAQHRTWFNLICFAAEQTEHRGEIRGYDLELLAVEVACVDGEALRATLDRLQVLRILKVEPDVITFLNWRKRQYTKPSDEPEQVKVRVTAHRNAKRNATNKEEVAKKRDVTREKRAITLVTRPEADTEAESDTDSPEETNVSSAASAARNGSPSDSELTLQQQTWAALRDALEYAPSKDNESEKGAWNKAIRVLLHSGERPDSILPLVEEYHERWPAIDCTPMALVKNLGLIRSARPKSPNGRGPPSNYLTSDQAATLQAKHQAEMDALGDRGVAHPIPRRQH